MTNLKLGTIVRETMNTHGVDPTRIYCIQTGAPIGRISLSELKLAIAVIGSDDVEDIADELATRTFASMRPSIAWNVIDSRTYNRLRLRCPRELLSHLMIRLYEPRDPSGNLKVPYHQRITNLRSRVAMWKLIESLPIDADRLNRLLLVLLRIDSMFNLNAVAVKSAFPAPATMTSDEAIDSYIEQIEEWHEYLWNQKSRLERQAKLSNEFWASRGNSVTRDATVKAFLEAKPPAESTIKKSKKKAADNEMLNLLQAIMDAAQAGDAPESAVPETLRAAKPSEKPVQQGVIPAGAKLNLGGRKIKLAGRNR